MKFRLVEPRLGKPDHSRKKRPSSVASNIDSCVTFVGHCSVRCCLLRPLPANEFHPGYRLLDREEERPEDPLLRLRLGLDRCTDGRVAERVGRPMPDLLGDRGAVRIVEPKVEPLEPCLGCTLRRLTVGLLRLVELERPNRRVDCLGLVDCLGFVGVRKIRGPDEKEGFCLLRPSDRCPREPPAKALSGWTRGVECLTPPCLFAVALEPALDPAAERSVPDRLGPTLMILGPPRRLLVEASARGDSPPLKTLGEVPSALPNPEVVVPEKPERVEVAPRRLGADACAAPPRTGLTVPEREAMAARPTPPLACTLRPPRTGFRSSSGSPCRNPLAMVRVGLMRRSSREPLPKSLSLTTFKPLPRSRGFHRLIIV